MPHRHWLTESRPGKKKNRRDNSQRFCAQDKTEHIFLYRLDRRQKPRGDQAERCCSVGRQQSCKHWADRQKGDLFTFSTIRTRLIIAQQFAYAHTTAQTSLPRRNKLNESLEWSENKNEARRKCRVTEWGIDIVAQALLVFPLPRRRAPCKNQHYARSW